MTDRLPPLLRGARRGLLARLVAVALVHAAAAVGSGLLVGRLLGDVGAPRGRLLADLGLLVVCVAGLGVTRYADRVLAERLGQDYVHEIRRGLIGHAMTSDAAPSLGITIARSTNDLASVRNWVALGIAPLVAFVPLVLASLAFLATLSWPLALVVGVPLAQLAVALWLVSGLAFERARALRRRRGSLAARVADTVTAAPGIVAAGGVERELRAIDRSGAKVARAAVDRARTAGLLRSVALVVPLLASAGAATLGALAVVDAASVATALTVVGILAGPVGEMGRVVEYRQNHRAARRIIAPLLAAASEEPATPPSGGPIADPEESAGGRVVVRGLTHDRVAMPELLAHPGDRIVIDAPTRAAEQALFARLVLPPRDGRTGVAVDGTDLASTGPRTRRQRVGHAARGATLERGTIARAVRYRRPDLPEEVAAAALATVGLAERVAELPEREGTMLRRGGEPLDRDEVARLQVARAMLGDPPLLLLEHVDADLGEEGARAVKELLADYPGVVVLASDRPQALLDDWRIWSSHPADLTSWRDGSTPRNAGVPSNA
ncbi:ABC transporter transmembrane domain-containing protein [Janibacter sp. G1551]|uniref:ABC transporter transmembrane domain-containing protein n=1 Tax=Janibacter sp. G1551 TaxID=3420440 RepID=UPI003D02AB8A